MFSSNITFWALDFMKSKTFTYDQDTLFLCLTNSSTIFIHFDLQIIQTDSP
nr:interleukin-2 homolog - human [Homo sapiens]